MGSHRLLGGQAATTGGTAVTLALPSELSGRHGPGIGPGILGQAGLACTAPLRHGRQAKVPQSFSLCQASSGCSWPSSRACPRLCSSNEATAGAAAGWRSIGFDRQETAFGTEHAAWGSQQSHLKLQLAHLALSAGTSAGCSAMKGVSHKITSTLMSCSTRFASWALRGDEGQLQIAVTLRGENSLRRAWSRSVPTLWVFCPSDLEPVLLLRSCDRC